MISADYISHSGGDLLVVNAARVSFAKQSDYEVVGPGIHSFFAPEVRLRDRDRKLIGYLARSGHWSPFSHPQVTLRVKAPIFVARQAVKSMVGFAVNEVSRRYVDEAPEFYAPSVWRGRAAEKKQGSSDVAVCMIDIGDDERAPPPTCSRRMPTEPRARPTTR